MFEEIFFPFYYAHSKTLFNELSHEQVDQILEKYVILSYLVNRDFLKYFSFNISYFEQTIFGKIITQKYPKREQIVKKYMEIHRKYKAHFDEFHNKEIDRILLFQADHLRSNFSQDFLQISQKLLTSTQKPAFIHSIIQQKEQLELMIYFIFKKIEKDLLKKIDSNKVEFINLVRFRQFLEGNVIPDNVQIAKKLFIEANNELEFFYLSNEFLDQKHLVAKAMFRTFLKTPSKRLNKIKGETEAMSAQSASNFDELKKRLDVEIDKIENKVENNFLSSGSLGDDIFNQNSNGQKIDFSDLKGQIVEEAKFRLNQDGMLFSARDKKYLKREIKEMELMLKEKEPDIFREVENLPEDEKLEKVMEHMKKGLKESKN